MNQNINLLNIKILKYFFTKNMVQYCQNSSPINIEGCYNQTQSIQIMGNMNQIFIGDTNSNIAIMGNGNVVNVVHSSLTITVQGNGNVFNALESDLKVNVQGNANTFQQEMEIKPFEIDDCQGFGNVFPQVTIKSSKPLNNYNCSQFSQSSYQSAHLNQLPKVTNSNKYISNNCLLQSNNFQKFISKQPLFANMINEGCQQKIINQNEVKDIKEMKLQKKNSEIQARNIQRETIRALEQARRQQNIRKQQQKIQQMPRKRFQQGKNLRNRYSASEKKQSSDVIQLDQYFKNQRQQINQQNHHRKKQISKNQLPDHGLSEQEMQKLHTHYHQGPEQQCTICFLEIYRNDESTFLHCFHNYHTFCIQSWLKKSSRCPICNENVRKKL